MCELKYVTVSKRSERYLEYNRKAHCTVKKCVGNPHK